MLYDITRELFSTPPYPGDPSSELLPIYQREERGSFLVQGLRCSLHAATHMDAALHILPNGADAAALPLTAGIGPCIVAPFLPAFLPKRLLLRGKQLCKEEAQRLTGLTLIGTDTNSVALPTEEAAVHIPLLGAGVCLLENLDLTAVEDGAYHLLALPLKLAGAEAAPARALLTEETEPDAATQAALDAMQARKCLQAGAFRCVLVRNGEERTALSRGVSPLLDWLDERDALEGAAVADRIVGKAAALLFVLGRVRSVHAEVLSRTGQAVLEQYAIPYSFGTLTERIRNRDNTDDCPMEKAVADVNAPTEALERLRETRDRLRRG